METGIIEFQDSSFTTAKDEVTQIIYLAMKPFVEAMGLSWKSQMVKLKSDNRFELKEIDYQTSGGIQSMLSLAMDHLPAYLYSINPNKVRKDLKEIILTFQAETFGVINSYWREKLSKGNNSKASETEYISSERVKSELLAIQTFFNNTTFNELQKVEKLKKLYSELKLSVSYFPKKSFSEQSFSLTKLLEKFDVNLTAQDLNRELEKIGFIEKRFLDKSKYLWFITEKGSKFGENAVYQDRTTPRYFEDKFKDLLKLILS